MKTLYFDIVGGIAGDMTVASLLGLGVPLEHLRAGLATMALEGLSIEVQSAVRHGIAGCRFVVTPPADGAGSGGGHGPGHGHPHRDFREVRRMIGASGLAPAAMEIAQRIFARLAEAEGEVHGIAPEAVTFHEVGGWDSIADIVCVALALDYLAPEAIFCSPVPVGAGTVKTAHGVMPVPAPATLLLLRGFPIIQGGPAYERTTPTGAAILAAMARPAPQPFALTPEKVGVGMGTFDGPEVPNLLRAIWAQTDGEAMGQGGAGDQPAAGVAETIECAEANMDDANPEWIGYLVERLQEAGALDVALIPIQMKKNRPGTLVQVLYPPALRAAVAGLLFAEGTTLGVRFRAMERIVLPREAVSVTTPWGEVAGKVARVEGRQRFAPEFDSCRQVARRAQVPLQEVYRAAQQAFAAAAPTPP
ncbi:MAG: nickel pincer cofactor biosynthesis protein LarC [bacterium]